MVTDAHRAACAACRMRVTRWRTCASRWLVVPLVGTSNRRGVPTGLPGWVHDPAGHMVSVQIDRERALPGQPVEASAAGVGSMVQDASRYQRARSGS